MTEIELIAMMANKITGLLETSVITADHSLERLQEEYHAKLTDAGYIEYVGIGFVLDTFDPSRGLGETCEHDYQSVYKGDNLSGERCTKCRDQTWL